MAYRYIKNIYYTYQGWLVIEGVIGTRRYMYYPKREAIKNYNQDAKQYIKTGVVKI